MRLLEDAVKTAVSNYGWSILNFEMQETGFYKYGISMPNEVIDKILEWRDKEYGKAN
jgi:hypothetical protein